jgi:hypothetical protein
MIVMNAMNAIYTDSPRTKRTNNKTIYLFSTRVVRAIIAWASQIVLANRMQRPVLLKFLIIFADNLDGKTDRRYSGRRCNIAQGPDTFPHLLQAGTPGVPGRANLPTSSLSLQSAISAEAQQP